MEFFRDVRPEDVFTPRSATVNKSMYVDRPEYERELKYALRSGYHLIVYGDSGCGKSWLYKKTFDNEGVDYATLDLNNCKTPDDVELLILEVIEQDQEWVEHERSELTEKGVMPYDVGRKKSGSRTLRKAQLSAFEKLCKKLRSAAKRRRAIVVFENLEHAIMNDDIVTYLRSLVLSLDDVSLCKENVQICFVGVPHDIKGILTEENRYQTISNRVTEISEVSRLTRDQAKILFRQGFEQRLQMEIEAFDYCLSQIVYLTDRIPQYIHDLCLRIAFVAEERGELCPPRL
ncbi:AAA domain-containing protein [Cognatiyoonia sediminum]|uniref:AAA domain-containing protein n=1 Tax=Cognatiyoonia sediminum TaxID=1508389 RepID=A0A1M5SHG9_9RHOB|nr:AAA family ATPase [Cognatiyoonia sediminum]SHH37986.1 AAA domain-containing protein [Cognatiyoonia sediminum]